MDGGQYAHAELAQGVELSVATFAMTEWIAIGKNLEYF